MTEAVRLPGVERLAGRQPGRAAAHRDGRLVAAGGLLGEQNSEDFGVLPPLARRGGDHLGRCSANVGHSQPAQQAVELVGQWWWGGRLDGHRPNPSQLRVERCSERSSEGARGERDHGRGLLVGKDAGQVTVGEPAVAGAPSERVVDRPGAVQLGQVDGFGHLATDPLPCPPRLLA